MKSNVALTINDNNCEHCGRSFARESTLLKHMCEQKRRWLDRDKPANRIGYLAWKNYFNSHHPSKKNTEYIHFLASSYYIAFIKFGAYCVDISAVNPASYAAYCVKNKIGIDSWPSDKVYTKYLISYLQTEDAYDAIKRSVDTLLILAKDDNLQLRDIFTFGNKNKICYSITNGKISPWILYNSSSGIQFLSSLNDGHTKLIFDYIQPQIWSIKFKKDEPLVDDIKKMLKSIPL